MSIHSTLWKTPQSFVSTKMCLLNTAPDIIIAYFCHYDYSLYYNEVCSYDLNFLFCLVDFSFFISILGVVYVVYMRTHIKKIKLNQINLLTVDIICRKYPYFCFVFMQSFNTIKLGVLRNGDKKLFFFLSKWASCTVQSSCSHKMFIV